MTSLFPVLCEPLQYREEALEPKEIARQNRVSCDLKDMIYSLRAENNVPHLDSHGDRSVPAVSDRTQFLTVQILHTAKHNYRENASIAFDVTTFVTDACLTNTCDLKVKILLSISVAIRLQQICFLYILSCCRCCYVFSTKLLRMSSNR